MPYRKDKLPRVLEYHGSRLRKPAFDSCCASVPRHEIRRRATMRPIQKASHHLPRPLRTSALWRLGWLRSLSRLARNRKGAWPINAGNIAQRFRSYGRSKIDANCIIFIFRVCLFRGLYSFRLPILRPSNAKASEAGGDAVSPCHTKKEAPGALDATLARADFRCSKD